MEPGSTPRPLVQKKTWRDSLPIDMLLSSVSVLVVAQSSSEIPEGLMNNPVGRCSTDRCCGTPLLLRNDKSFSGNSPPEVSVGSCKNVLLGKLDLFLY